MIKNEERYEKTKIITCTGYGGTGSSAITDLLKEFQNVYSYGDVEFRFLQIQMELEI